MTISFETKHLNKKLYRRLIVRFINTTFARDDVTDFRLFKEFVRTWNIVIYPSSRASEDPFFYGKDGVGGVTSNRLIKLYLEDKKTRFGDLFQRTFRQNTLVISHEICHGILMYLGMNNRVRLRHDDYGRNKAGTELNFSTAEVHDRHTEGRFRNMYFWFRYHIPKLMFARVLDIRDIV